MVERVGMFEKVSFEQWVTDCEDKEVIGDDIRTSKEDNVKAAYESIKLPERSTAGSAGYDFYLPYDIFLNAGESIVIPTGIKAYMDAGWVLMLFPRSSLGYKYNLRFANTVGIIDADYYNNANNEGDISVKFVNDGKIPVILKQGVKMCQGLFVPFGITTDDNAKGTREGGIGSTGA